MVGVAVEVVVAVVVVVEVGAVVAVDVGVVVGVVVAVGVAAGGVDGGAVDSAREVAVKERPILFSATMVRAILAGRKTQTRRIAKHMRGAAPVYDPSWNGKCPYGMPGARLWVKETWRPERDNQCERITYAADGAVAHENEVPDSWRRPKAASKGWVSPLFMPRWASRLALELTSVRVERLQSISEADAVAEGVERTVSRMAHTQEQWRDYSGDEVMTTARESYASLWESINGAGSWSSNPWVWVVEFKQVSTSPSEVRTA